MKKKFFFKKKIDISHYNDLSINYNKIHLRDLLRDLVDKLIRRPIYKLIYKNFFKKQNYQIDLTLPSKGFSSNERKKKLNTLLKIKGKDILCLGCGNGFDIPKWFKYEPNSITAIDLLNYSKSWKKIQNFVKKNKIKTKVVFLHKDILKLNIKKKYDFIVSDAVFEHLINFETVIKFCNKILKKNGIIYASYGPLWPCYGGDHFSSRGKIESGFNHVLLDKKKYDLFFKKNVHSLHEELKHHGSAGIFVKEKLFSKLNANDYIKIFKKNNLSIIFLIVEYCPKGYFLIKHNLEIKSRLEKIKFYNNEDFYLKSHIIYLKKKN